MAALRLRLSQWPALDEHIRKRERQHFALHLRQVRGRLQMDMDVGLGRVAAIAAQSNKLPRHDLQTYLDEFSEFLG